MSRQMLQLAVQQHKAGQLAEAEKLYRQILINNPNEPTALHLLGLLLAARDDQGIAGMELIRRAIAVKPDYVHAHYNLAELLRKTGRSDDAIASYRRAIALKSDFAEAHHGLGQAFEVSGQPDRALESYRRALALRPQYPEACSNAAAVLMSQGKLEDAAAAFNQALALRPDDPQTLNNLGVTLRQLGQTEQAVACYQKALAIRPNDPATLNNLGVALRELCQIEGAIAAHRQAVTLKPDYAEALGNLGADYAYGGLADDAILAMERAVECRPDDPGVHDTLLFFLHLNPKCDEQRIWREHVLWNERHALRLAKFIPAHRNDRSADRPLRVGYVSPDFRDHSVGYFIDPILRRHNREQFHVFCYSCSSRCDSVTERMQSYGNTWRPIHALSDEQAAALIASDGIDILIDLAGHTAGNRLQFFARKPAPIQVTYLGYPNTTGLNSIDFRLTDVHADPPGIADSLHSEKLWRLPRIAWCYAPPADCPDTSPPPCLSNGIVTFGSFNALHKLTMSMIALWSTILSRLPTARLMLKNASLKDAATARRIREAFMSHGISADRIDLLGVDCSHLEHLRRYNQVDIALDSFPYNGTTTTCEALYMGVPVVSLVGTTHASRVGASLLTNLALEEFLAGSEEQYVDIAVRTAQNHRRLMELRDGMRRRMQASALMDEPGFVRELEMAYRQMWKDVVAKGPDLR